MLCFTITFDSSVSYSLWEVDMVGTLNDSELRKWVLSFQKIYYSYASLHRNIYTYALLLINSLQKLHNIVEIIYFRNSYLI